MTTRFYLPFTAATTPISPTADAAWEDVSALLRAMTSTSRIGNAMATVTFSDANATNRDIAVRQYISAELVAGQVITGAQNVSIQARIAQDDVNNNLFLTMGIRVLGSDGTTVRKTILAVSRDDLEADIVLTNRGFISTSVAGDYTVLAGDRLVIEVGAAGDPDTGEAHEFTLRLGDAAATDLAVDNTDTTDLCPWVQFTDNLLFVGTTNKGAAFMAALMV